MRVGLRETMLETTLAEPYRIALIPGDGIGGPVTDAAFAVASRVLGSDRVSGVTFPWSCEYYLEHGRMMPEDGIETLRSFDAIFLGAVGWPKQVPDSVSLHGLLLPIRKAFVQYANIRPHRLLPGVVGPLTKTGFDILCIRENTEGEYSGAGGRVHVGTPDEVAVETSVFTRTGVERILRFAFEQAMRRRKNLASVTKSNAQKYSMVFWDEITDRLASEYPDVEVTHYHVDAMCARMVMAPESLDVVVASNLFGDILTDLGAAIQGGLASPHPRTSIRIGRRRPCSSPCMDRRRTSRILASPIPWLRSGRWRCCWITWVRWRPRPVLSRRWRRLRAGASARSRVAKGLK